MTEIFAKVLNLSIVGTMAIVIVVIARQFLKNKPKIFSYMLWGVVFFRLICPFSFSSAHSIIGSISGDTNYVNIPQLTTANKNIAEIGSSVSLYIPSPTPSVSSNPIQTIFFILTAVWLVGVFAIFLYTVFSFIRIKKRVETATLIYDNVYETDRIQSPFVMGINPKIYIPIRIEKKDLQYILEHEKTHIRRLDFLVKPFAYAIAILHWFNPFVWLAFALMNKDMEMSCDEGVLKTMAEDSWKEYSYALLNTSAKNSGFLRPIGFGESNVKERIKNILTYKKTEVFAIITTVIVCCAVAFFVLANPHEAKVNGRELGSILSQYDDNIVELNGMITFDYDYVIQFPPYAPKKSMEEMLGFNCSFLNEGVSEGMMNVLFVKNDKAVCYIYGYGENNNFYLSLPDGVKIQKKDIGTFFVTTTNGYPTYISNNDNYGEGTALLTRANELLEAKNPYIGDPSANGKIIRLLTWPETASLNGTELQTTTEPYGLTIDILTDSDMQSYIDEYIGSSQYYQNALVMLALIDNCGSVSFRFNNSNTITYTRAQIEKNIGYDVRLMTLNTDDFSEFLKYCETAEDYSKIIEKLEALSAPTELSNTREVIEQHYDDYDYLLKYGNRTVNYVLNQFAHGVDDDLRSAIMALAVYDILGERCNVDPSMYTKTSEWYNDFKMREEITPTVSFTYSGNDKKLKVVYETIKMTELAKSSYNGILVPAVYVVDTIEDGNNVRMFLSVKYSYFKVYETENGAILSQQGGETRATVVTLSKDSSGSYIVKAWENAGDGSEFSSSLKRMCVDFDGNEIIEIYEKMANSDSKDLENARRVEINKVFNDNLVQYLHENGIDNFSVGN
ncbi:MAG: M56 family metallopeptidase [Anaerotignaceae bacterium]